MLQAKDRLEILDRLEPLMYDLTFYKISLNIKFALPDDSR